MGEAGPLNLLKIATWLVYTWEIMPLVLASLFHVCTCKDKDKKPTNKQWKEKMQRAYEKQINKIDMASKETRKQANKRKGKQARRQTKGGVCEGQM